MNLIIEISSYITIAILLGLFFGWLITKLLLKDKCQKELSTISKELHDYQEDNRRLKVKNKELTTNKSSILDESNEISDNFQKRLEAKDELLLALTNKLTFIEEKQEEIVKKYEEEIDAFMSESIDITQKYKALLEKFNAIKVE